VAHFKPESVAHFKPESVAQIARNIHDIAYGQIKAKQLAKDDPD